MDPLREALSHFSLCQQPCQITVVDFSDELMQKYEFDNQGLIDFLQQPREEWVSCRWVNVNGISWDVIRALGQDQKLHRLAIEDLLSTGSRTKADFYQSHSFGKSLSVFSNSVMFLCLHAVTSSLSINS